MMKRKQLPRRTRALAAPALAFFLQAFAPPVADAAPLASPLQAVPGLTVGA